MDPMKVNMQEITPNAMRMIYLVPISACSKKWNPWQARFLGFWVFGLLCVWEVWEVGREEGGL